MHIPPLLYNPAGSFLIYKDIQVDSNSISEWLHVARTKAWPTVSPFLGMFLLIHLFHSRVSACMSQRKYVFGDPTWVTCQWCRVKPNLVLQRVAPLQWHHADRKPVPFGQSPSEHDVTLCAQTRMRACVWVCCFALGVNWPSHQLASLAAECRGWWGNEGFSRCPPQAERKAGIPEPASATCTDWSVWRDRLCKQ